MGRPPPLLGPLPLRGRRLPAGVSEIRLQADQERRARGRFLGPDHLPGLDLADLRADAVVPVEQRAPEQLRAGIGSGRARGEIKAGDLVGVFAKRGPGQRDVIRDWVLGGGRGKGIACPYPQPFPKAVP